MAYRCEGRPHSWKDSLGDGSRICMVCGAINLLCLRTEEKTGERDVKETKGTAPLSAE